MFLKRPVMDEGKHELDFRFELAPAGDEFLFAHHGLNLADFVETIDVSLLGSAFFMVELCSPFGLHEVVAQPDLFRARYGAVPEVFQGAYLRLGLEDVQQFFLATHEDDELDCTILATRASQVPAHDLEQYCSVLGGKPFAQAPAWKNALLYTHDNHFFYLEAQGGAFLRTLIAESILGFFSHIHPTRYAPLPVELIDLIASQYHTASLVCEPTYWSVPRNREVPGGIEIKEHEVRVLIVTERSHWTSYQVDIPPDRLDLGLLVSYDLVHQCWSYERW